MDTSVDLTSRNYYDAEWIDQIGDNRKNQDPLLPYQMTTNSAVNRNLACVSNN